jgi:hypothetical protein
LAIFRSRSITPNDLVLVFLACVFPIHLWSIWNLLQVIPAWILRATVWELIGVIAYTQLFALIESAILFAILVGMGLLLPYKIFAHKFVAYSSAFMVLNSVWFVVMQYNYSSIRLWGMRQFLLWIFIFLVTNLIAYLIVSRSHKLEVILKAATQRVAVLSSIYVAFSVLSLFVIVIRNI